MHAHRQNFSVGLQLHCWLSPKPGETWNLSLSFVNMMLVLDLRLLSQTTQISDDVENCFASYFQLSKLKSPKFLSVFHVYLHNLKCSIHDRYDQNGNQQISALLRNTYQPSFDIDFLHFQSCERNSKFLEACLRIFYSSSDVCGYRSDSYPYGKLYHNHFSTSCSDGPEIVEKTSINSR